MAIAYDTSSYNSGTTGTTHNLTHTCSGSDRILFWSGLVISGSDVVTGVTYNGVSMTRVDIVLASLEGIVMYYLVNPATGSNTISATTSGSTTIYAQATSYTGASQTGQLDAFNKNGYSGNGSMSTSVTTTADNCWLVGCFRAGADQTGVAGTTLRAGVNLTINAGDSNGSKTPAGSYSLGTTWATGTGAQIVASFKPVGSTVINGSGFLFYI